MNGACNGTFFFAHPLGPWGGTKGQILLNIYKFQSQSHFQRFLNQTLCVFLLMKDIKHIRRDFHLAVWIKPRGWDLGYRGGWGHFFFQNSTRFGVWVTRMNAICNGTLFLVPVPWGLGEGPKGQISLNLTKSISKIFKPNFVYLFTNERNITYQTG